MPILELSGDADDRAWVSAVMDFPSDERIRTIAYARMKAEAEVQDVKDHELLKVDAKTIRLLLDSPSPSEFKKEKQKATKAGFIAGRLLSMVYLMSEVSKTPTPSLNKAVHACLELEKSGDKWGDGKPLPKSESIIRQAWASHKSVSHLWAAIDLNGNGYKFAEPADVFHSQFPVFLGVAAGLLDFGCTFMPEYVKTPAPILDPTKVWTLPPSIAIRRLRTNRQPTRLLEFLRGYKAPQPMG